MGEGRTLLILGEPGAGKTIALLKLAEDLIVGTTPDLRQQIPVVFNLSSWAIGLDEVEVDFPDFWLAEDGKMEEGDLERMEPGVSTESFMTEQIKGIQRSQREGMPNNNISLD
jgi:hypothetical protein